MLPIARIYIQTVTYLVCKMYFQSQKLLIPLLNILYIGNLYYNSICYVILADFTVYIMLLLACTYSRWSHVPNTGGHANVKRSWLYLKGRSTLYCSFVCFHVIAWKWQCWLLFESNFDGLKIATKLSCALCLFIIALQLWHLDMKSEK